MGRNIPEQPYQGYIQSSDYVSEIPGAVHHKETFAFLLLGRVNMVKDLIMELKMKLKTLLGVLITALALLSCGKSPSINITIEDYGWYSENIDSGYWSSPFTTTAYHTINIIFENKNLTAGDIQKIEITNPTGGIWDFEGSEIPDRFDESSSTFHASRLYHFDSPHLLAIGDWQVVATSSSGTVGNATVNFPAPGSTTTGSKTHFYTEDYSSTIYSSYVQAPKRASSISASDDGSSLGVSFSVTDSSIYNGYIWVYDSSGNYLTSCNYFREGLSGSVASFVNSGAGLNVDGTANTLAITVSDFVDPVTISDIAEIVVVLTDGGQYAGQGNYWDYRSISNQAIVP